MKVKKVSRLEKIIIDFNGNTVEIEYDVFNSGILDKCAEYRDRIESKDFIGSNEQMREYLDSLFEYPMSEILFTDCEPLTMAEDENGNIATCFEHVLYGAIIPQLKEHRTKHVQPQRDKMNQNIRQFTGQ